MSDFTTNMLKIPFNQRNTHDYEYQALESPSHIRLIELLPTNFQNDRHVHCKIHYIDLDPPTYSYVALSYVWGDPVVRSEQIYVNGNLIFYVTKILHSALSRLRLADESFFLWVDAICINQANESERNAQVILMHKIYSEAMKVVIDLGDVRRDDKVIINGLTKLSLHDEQWETIYEDDAVTTGQLPLLEYPGAAEPFWPALSRLFQRSWFFRTWVIQELALGKESEVLLGQDLLSLDFFARTTRRAIELTGILDVQRQFPTGLAKIPWGIRLHWIMLRNLPRVVKYIIQGQLTETNCNEQQSSSEFSKVYDTNFGAMYYTRLTARRFVQEHVDNERMERSVQWGPVDYLDVESLEFPVLFFKFRHFKCGDPRDHVYGLLGLATDRSDPELRVDYSESVEMLSVRISRYIIRKGFGVLVLYAAACGTAKSPSWAMNIGKDPPVDFLRRTMLDSLENDWNLYSACGSTALNLQVLPENDRLLARGILIGTISGDQTDPFPMKPPRRFPESMAESFTSFLLLLQAWAVHVSLWIQQTADWCTTVSEDDLKRMWWRTLLADLRYTSENICRIGVSLEHEAFSSPLRAIFDAKSRLRDRALATRDGFAVTVLWRSLPGRKLGLAESHFERENKHSGETTLRETWMCLLPEAAEEGDEVGILCGCPIPLVFRKDSDVEMYRIIGCCYVDGAMDGQIVDWKVESKQWQDTLIALC
jgi:hypothetical protein